MKEEPIKLLANEIALWGAIEHESGRGQRTLNGFDQKFIESQSIAYGVLWEEYLTKRIKELEEIYGKE